MKINMISDRQILEETLKVLVKEMEPWKVARFIASCGLGSGDYLQAKEELFADETVDSLSEKIQAFNQSQQNHAG
ncbi:hypothetical protein [Synechococcus sp. PCC 6312]|uniref:hypothetical protein n=1 Tax=Synechococcus sp. (strain ATCC 27167 / PCC 6312) TaxID=195253 RepID=UPI00029F0E4D|nr:hypothetical protein [Synechococcus sp. PCC 6312]AFY60092.1 hypothetical protein Syn6312_0884 [Synechococcus sp. PCC 6312]